MVLVIVQTCNGRLLPFPVPGGTLGCHVSVHEEEDVVRKLVLINVHKTTVWLHCNEYSELRKAYHFAPL